MIDNANGFNYEDEAKFNQHTPSKDSDNVACSDIVIKAKELVNTVQNDKTMRKSIFTTLLHWISLFRHDEQLDIKFELFVPNGSTVNINTNEPVPTVANGVLDTKRMNRKQSHIEIHKQDNISTINASVLNNRKKQYKKIKK